MGRKCHIIFFSHDIKLSILTFWDVGFHGDGQGASADDWLNSLASGLDLKTLNLAPANFLTACKACTLFVYTKSSSEI